MSAPKSFRVGNVTVRRFKVRGDGTVYWRCVTYRLAREFTLWCQWSTEEEARRRAERTEAPIPVATRPGLPQRVLQDVNGGCVYFAQAGNGGLVKIGHSRRMAKRLSSLQTSTGEVLRLLAVMPGPRRLEAVMHRAFRHLHVRGEWFRPGASLLALVDEITPQPPAPEA